MRSASLSDGATGRRFIGVLTGGEKTFRNAKLRRASLVAYKSLADAAGKGSLFVITVVAARQLPPRAFGVFGLGTTIGWLLSVVADFGVQMHLARAVAQAPHEAPALLRRWWRARLGAAAAALALLVTGMLAWKVNGALIVPLSIFALAYLAAGLVEFLNYFYRGLSRTDIESTLTIWQRGATLVLAVTALTWTPDVTMLALAMLAPTLVTLAWSARIATRIAPFAPRSTHPLGAVEGGFLRDVSPIGLGIVLSAMYFRVDVLLVQLWAGTEAVAGYNAVFKVIDALRVFPAALLAVVLPLLCRAPDLRLLARVAGGVTVFGVLTAAVLWPIAGRLVPLLFGAHYATAVPAFRVLTLSFPLLSLNFALTHQLVGWHRERAYAGACAAALAVNLGLNAWLIPAWSIEGAAWATLGTELCLTAGCVSALAVARR